MNRFNRRLMIDGIMQGLATIMAIFALAMMAWILVTLVTKGANALSLKIFYVPMGPPDGSGGLANAVVGSLIQVAIATVISAPIGVLAGTYLSELGQTSAFGNSVRFINDVLLSAPSILIGLFVYDIAVRPAGAYSALAGALALAIVILPVVVRSTEDMLRLVPGSLREAAFALGAPQWKVVMSVLWRAGRAGIVTGLLLALARAAGETAPLIFTSLGNSSWSFDLTQPMGSLPAAIYQYASSSSSAWVDLSWAGALVITVGVLVLNITSRIVLAGTGRK
jgi:phosphate transport system permease protein